MQPLLLLSNCVLFGERTQWRAVEHCEIAVLSEIKNLTSENHVRHAMIMMDCSVEHDYDDDDHNNNDDDDERKVIDMEPT